MTEKQENILTAAFGLFAEKGYHATSTSRVAKRAGVSEGLVFRHFNNKAGLMEAVLKEGEKRIRSVYAEVVMETDPKEVLRKAIKLPFSIPEEDFEFWKLQYKLKWEVNHNATEKLKPFHQAVSDAFKNLGHSKPDLEADLLIHLLEGISSSLIKGHTDNGSELEALILRKYQL